ncbi:hypothetical protein E2C01_061165 [Portunus trituberculatus]|uniref:Uncharacterized protein n=1 Tax=Portunus trituberculatus TaxID=210409 RepID=A0A5B7HBI3_PORTR|nr:hypothetical protein [Portunus trituberculatus]
MALRSHKGVLTFKWIVVYLLDAAGAAAAVVVVVVAAVVLTCYRPLRQVQYVGPDMWLSGEVLV